MAQFSFVCFFPSDSQRVVTLQYEHRSHWDISEVVVNANQ